jgi:hypothetical protein
MWLFLSDAFLSVVAHRDDPGMLLVRARANGDIQRVFPLAQVTETPDADYRYRATLPRQEVALALAAQVEGIGYDNFKGSIHERDRHDACMDVWATMHRFQGNRAQLRG